MVHILTEKLTKKIDCYPNFRILSNLDKASNVIVCYGGEKTCPKRNQTSQIDMLLKFYNWSAGIEEYVTREMAALNNIEVSNDYV